MTKRRARCLPQAKSSKQELPKVLCRQRTAPCSVIIVRSRICPRGRKCQLSSGKGLRRRVQISVIPEQEEAEKFFSRRNSAFHFRDELFVMDTNLSREIANRTRLSGCLLFTRSTLFHNLFLVAFRRNLFGDQLRFSNQLKSKNFIVCPKSCYVLSSDSFIKRRRKNCKRPFCELFRKPVLDLR